MLKRILKSTLLLGLFVTAFTSCKEECQTCTITQIITEDGVEIGRQTLNSETEYCGDALDTIKGSAATIDQEVGGYSQSVETKVDCN